MAIITINGTPMPEPSKYSVSTNDLHADSSTRTETGRLIINRIRANVYKIECGWSAITSNQLNVIKNATNPVTVSVTFLDGNGAYVTKTMYSGDKKIDPVKIFDNDKRWNYSFNLIEV